MNNIITININDADKNFNSNELKYNGKLFTGKIIFPEYYAYVKNGYFHNENNPAVIYKNGNKEYLYNGYRHRLDGPAIQYNDGNNCFYIMDEYIKPENYEFEVRKFKMSVFK